MGHHYRLTIARTLGFLLIAGATLLVFNDSQTPGFCPAYPVLGTPACYIMLIYFITVTSALFATPGRTSKMIFLAAGALSIASGLYFSTLELATPGPQCPRLFAIPLPLCFTVAPTIALILFFGWKGWPKPAKA